MKRRIVALMLVGCMVGTVGAAEPGSPTNTTEKFSYAMGMTLGVNLKRFGADLSQVDASNLVRGLKDALTGAKTDLTEAEAREVVITFQREARRLAGEKNKQAAEAFLAENKGKDGVVTLPSGLQYKVLVEGKGEAPKTNDVVRVNYRGTLLDGTEFDSSFKRGQPATFSLGGVIEGWKQGLALMKPGGKSQLFIPPHLGYAERGSGSMIGPHAALIFEVELMAVNPPQAAAPAQPVTSDIIRVPSADERKAGAQIEVIKASEVDKYKEAEKAKAEKEKAEKK